MSQRRRRRQHAPAPPAPTASWRRLRRSWWILGLPVVVALAALVAWSRFGPRGEAPGALGGLPGPLGGPSVAQDVNTLVGQPAPSFTLADSEGQSYAVTPGRGRPIVLVFHMGIT